MSESSKILPEGLPRAVGLLGGGVIGGGWAARFLLNGVNVRLYDPAPDALERVQVMLANARRAYRRLTAAPMPAEGSLTLVKSLEEAVREVDLVQESVPERLNFKQHLFAAAGRAAAPGTLICSSTSGFRPSLLQAEMDNPECLLVAHPFQPVYMLPLVELCAGQRTAPEMVERAAAIFRAVGMHPLVVRKEVDGFVANRLTESISREALWLVHDDVATLGEIDDAIRFSWALRRATVGTYRMADGAAGMRDFMERWAFKWPWSRITDEPEIDRAFVEKVAEQADAIVAADPMPIHPEQKRDDLLVAVLHALRSQDYGPGRTLARWEQGLRDRAPQPQINGSGPLRTPTLEMTSDWLDQNGHVSETRFLDLCGLGCANVLKYAGANAEYRSKYGRYFTAETHLTHLKELYAGDRVQVLTQVLGVDDKRLHLFYEIMREGDKLPAASGEQILIHVDAKTRRSGPVKGDVRERLMELADLHAKLPRPERAGASIGMRR